MHEAEIMAKLDHPNIVRMIGMYIDRLFDIWKEDNKKASLNTFIADEMRFVSVLTLDSV